MKNGAESDRNSELTKLEQHYPNSVQRWEDEGGAVPVVAEELEIAEKQKIRKKKRRKTRKGRV